MNSSVIIISGTAVKIKPSIFHKLIIESDCSCLKHQEQHFPLSTRDKPIALKNSVPSQT